MAYTFVDEYLVYVYRMVEFRSGSGRSGGIAMGRLLLPLVVAVFAGPAPAQNAPSPAPAQTTVQPASGQWPSIKGLKPYSDETNGMSLSGFLRYLTFQQTGRWISNDDAERVVKQQLSK